MQAANAAFDKDAVEKELEEKLEEVRMLWHDVAKSQHLEVNPRGLSDHCGVCFLQVTVADEDVYNPKSSFFDNISCEAKGRGPRRTRYVAHLHLRLTRHHSFGLLGVSETAPTRLCVCVCVSSCVFPSVPRVDGGTRVRGFDSVGRKGGAAFVELRQCG
jgi:hypothetical protein